MATRTTSYPRLSRLALPYTRLELPGWGKVFDAFRIGESNDPIWRDAPTKTVRGKWHGYRMDLDLRNWSERHTYFLGRFYDLPTQALMTRVIRPGDRVIDVGANIGMLTLHAASLVGPGGRVDSFEPNPTCQERIEAHLARNAIGHVVLHRVALADRPGSLTLRIPADHTGMGTLADLSEEERSHFSVEVPVAVVVGDDVVEQVPRPVSFIKIDVEGFETQAIRGLSRTLGRFKPLVTTEVIASWLRRAGSSPGELADLMDGLGYRGYRLSIARDSFRRTLRLVPVPASGFEQDELSDVLWVHPEGPGTARLGDILPGG